MILYRPVGQTEYDLIKASGYTKFPPRLPEQPIFYPVLNEKYASEIAEKWNTVDKNSGYVGYVLKFEIEDEYISKYEVQQAGASYHLEYWIPAEELEAFNSHIVGYIRASREFKGDMWWNLAYLSGGKPPIAEVERCEQTGKIIKFTGDSVHLNEWLDEEDLYD